MSQIEALIAFLLTCIPTHDCQAQLSLAYQGWSMVLRQLGIIP